MPNKCEGRRPRQSAFDPPFSTRTKGVASDDAEAPRTAPKPTSGGRIRPKSDAGLFSAVFGQKKTLLARERREGCKKRVGSKVASEMRLNHSATLSGENDNDDRR